MALTETMSNTWKRALLESVSGDSYKMSLMNPTFAFDKDIHATYTDISGEELAAGSGYTGSGEQMAISGEVSEDDGNDRARLHFLDVTFNVTSGESLGPIGGASVRDEDLSGEAIVGYVDFGSSYTVSGETLLMESFKIEIN